MTRAGLILYAFAKALLLLGGRLLFRLSATGTAAIPRLGGLLVASNHISHLDPPFVGISVPRPVQNMAKKELFKIGFLRWFMSTIGTILVDRGQGSQAVTDAVAAVKAGGCVVIFPEGTRSKSGVLSKGHSGAIVIAIRSGCPIVPAAIIGSDKAMGKGSKFIKPCKITVYFGEPYRIAYQGSTEQIPREVLERERFVLMQKIEALLPEHMRPSPEQKREWYGQLAAG